MTFKVKITSGGHYKGHSEGQLGHVSLEEYQSDQSLCFEGQNAVEGHHSCC